VEQCVYLGINESRNNRRGQLQCCCHGHHVRENRSVVPAKMAIGTYSVLPSVAPIRAGADDHGRRMSDEGSRRRGMIQHATVVATSQTPERKIAGAEMINAGFEIRKIAAYQVQLEFVQCASAGGSPEINLTAGVGFLFCYAS